MGVKILLIQPNSRYCFEGLTSASVPHGLICLAAALRARGDEVRILDARLERLNRPETARRMKAFSPDIVGLTGMSIDGPEVHVLAELAKRTLPACKVLAGGPYAITSPEQLAGDPNVDFAVLGEGERTACELVAALEHGRDTSAIAGLAFKGPGGVVRTRPREMIEDLDALPLPAWDLIDPERYFSTWTRHSQNPFLRSERILPLFTSRGCPFGCVYCHNIFGKKIRLRSAEKVLEELELLTGRYGAREIEIVDDIFNLDLVRAKKICDELVRRGIKTHLSFPNGLRVDRMDGELIDKLKAAGAHMVVYAIESASPRLQKLIGKNLDLEKAGVMVRATAARGILVGGFFMLGFPGETREEMAATVDYACGLPFGHANFFYVTPRQGTALFALAQKEKPGFEKAALNSYFKFSVNLSAVPDGEFQEIVDGAWSRFYRNPLKTARAMWRVPKLYMLKLILRGFFLRRWA